MEKELSFADLRRAVSTVVYEQINTATPTLHNLGRKPIGCVVLRQSSGTMVIYQTDDDISASTSDHFVSRSTAAGAATIEVV